MAVIMWAYGSAHQLPATTPVRLRASDECRNLGMDAESPGEPNLAYRLPLGDAWARIRLDENAEADVRALLDTAFTGVPDEAAAETRNALAQRFSAQIQAARSKSGLDLYLPSDPVHLAGGGNSASAVILAAKVVIPAAVAPDPVEVVTRVAAANPAARTGIIGGTPAVRIDHSGLTPEQAAAAEADEDDGEETTPRRRHIEYVMAVPNDPEHRWLSLALTAQAAAGQDATGVDAKVADFDQAVATMEFQAP